MLPQAPGHLQSKCRPLQVPPTPLGVCTTHQLLDRLFLPKSFQPQHQASKPRMHCREVQAASILHAGLLLLPKDVAASLGTWNQGGLTERKPIVKAHFGPFFRNALGQPVGQYRKKLLVRSILFCFLNFFVCVCVAGLSFAYLKIKPISLYHLEIKT